MTATQQKPDFDLDYSIHDFEAGTRRDSKFIYRAIEDTMLDLATEVLRGRVLDVACGEGKQAMRIAQRGSYIVGVEASMEMIGLGRYLHPESQAHMARSLAETLPFQDGAFDRVICQGSLDHFADPPAFMREAARVCAPEGRVVIALANFESLSCKAGRNFERLKSRVRKPIEGWRFYWEIPLDHNVKGTLPYVRSLGGDALVLDRCWGISLFWLFGLYGRLLDALPGPAAEVLFGGLDRIARRRPQDSDMIISVWRKPEAAPWRTTR